MRAISRDDGAFVQWLDEADSAFTEVVRDDVDVERALVRVKWRAATRTLDAPKENHRAVGDDLEEIVGAARDGEPYAVERLLGVIDPLMIRYCRCRAASGRSSCSGSWSD